MWLFAISFRADAAIGIAKWKETERKPIHATTATTIRPSERRRREKKLLRQSSKQSMITVCCANTIYYISTKNMPFMRSAHIQRAFIDALTLAAWVMHVIENAVAPFHLKVERKIYTHSEQSRVELSGVQTKCLQKLDRHFTIYNSLDHISIQCNSQTMQQKWNNNNNKNSCWCWEREYKHKQTRGSIYFTTNDLTVSCIHICIHDMNFRIHKHTETTTTTKRSRHSRSHRTATKKIKY